MPTSPLPKPLRLFAFVSMALSALASAVALICKHVLHLPRPYSVILSGNPRGFDLWYVDLMKNIHSYNFFPPGQIPDYRYPAPDVLLYLPWVHVPHRVFAFEAVTVAIFIGCALLLAKALANRGLPLLTSVLFTFLVLACSYPAWFEWRQTNVEVFVFVLLALAIKVYLRGAFDAAALLVGFAAAFKLTPIVFLIIFLLRKQYRAALIAVLAGTALTIPCLFLLTPSFMYSLNGVRTGIAAYNKLIVQTLIPYAAGYDHSVFTIVKYVQYGVLGSLRKVEQSQHFYLAAVIVLVAGVLWTKVRFLPIVNQIAFLTTAMTFLVPSSFDYTLLHLYVPFAMIVLVAVGQKGHVPGLVAVLVCFALLTAPESFLISHGRSFGGQFKAGVSLLLLYLQVRFPLWSEFDERFAKTAGHSGATLHELQH